MMLNNNSGVQLRLSFEAWAGVIKMNKTSGLKNNQFMIQERLAYLEKVLQEQADKQQREMEAEKEAREAQTKSQQMKTMQMMLNNNSGVQLRLSFEAWAGVVKMNKTSSLKNHQVTIQDRLAYLENTVQELADKNERELKAEKEAREAQTK